MQALPPSERFLEALSSNSSVSHIALPESISHFYSEALDLCTSFDNDNNSSSFPHPYAGLISVFDERVTATGVASYPRCLGSANRKDIPPQSAMQRRFFKPPSYAAISIGKEQTSITDERNSDRARTQRRSLEKNGLWEYKDPLVRVGNAFMDLASMEDTNSYYATLDRDYKHQFADVFDKLPSKLPPKGGPEHCICLKDKTKSVD
jgi:hypothetical protein